MVIKLIQSFRQLVCKASGCLLLYLSVPTLLFAANLEGIKTYQKNIHLSEEHKENLKNDILRYQNADNIWDALRDDFSLNHEEHNPLVQEKIEWFLNNQDSLMQSASRAAPYLYYILQQVKKRHLPAELVLIPIIESGYNPFSMSNMGASGIWQLMPETALGLGVKQDWWYDGRRDVLTSTRAALNYLAYLQSFFEGNWLLAIAAYNTGEGNVLAAIKRNIRQGRPTNFWALPVAQQTRDYVPRLLALAAIISHPDIYPIALPKVRNAPYLAQVDIGGQINLKYAALLAGLSHKQLMQLNPGFNRPSSVTKGPYKLVVPIQNVEQLSMNLAGSSMKHPRKWLHYTTHRGETLIQLAKKFKTTPGQIRQANQLKSNIVVEGAHLIVPNNEKILAHSNDSVLSILKSKKVKLKNQVMITSIKPKVLKKPTREAKLAYQVKPGDTVYVVRPHDSLVKLAKRYHVSITSLLAANHFSLHNLVPGNTIIVPTHHKNIPFDKLKKIAPTQTYIVKRGDSLEKLARQFKTTPTTLQLINISSRETLNPGQKIIIPTHLTS